MAGIDPEDNGDYSYRPHSREKEVRIEAAAVEALTSVALMRIAYLLGRDDIGDAAWQSMYHDIGEGGAETPEEEDEAIEVATRNIYSAKEAMEWLSYEVGAAIDAETKGEL